MTMQDLFATLDRFWAAQGCLLAQPYEIEVGAGTMYARHLPALPRPRAVEHRLRAALPAARRTAATARTPTACGRYFQYQVIMKPSPADASRTWRSTASRPWASTRASMTSASSRTTGSRPPWARPASAGRCGSTAWRSASTPTSSRWAGCSAGPVAVELTYGPERLAMYLQGVEDYRELQWSTTSDLRRAALRGGAAVLALQPRAGGHGHAGDDVRHVRGRGAADHRGRPPAARVRLRAQVLAPVQPAGRARRHQRLRAHRR